MAVKSKATVRKTKPPGPFAQRVANLQQTLLDRKVDGAIISNPYDQFYLSGFTGEDGAVLITPRQVWLVTDGRFTEQALRQAPWAKVLIRKGNLARAAGELAGTLHIQSLLVQPESVTLEMAGALRKHLPKFTKVVRGYGVVRDMRRIKDSGEVEAIVAAIRISEEALAILRRRIRPGMTESDVAALIEYEMKKRGASGPCFPTIAAVDANAALPHYQPGTIRVPKNGLVLIDWGARLGEYCGDLTRVLLLGKVAQRTAKLYRAVLDAQLAGIAAIAPGVRASDVDRAARAVLEKAGLAKHFVHGLGHGLGIEVHEGPRVSASSADILVPGMVVTVEPGVYLPGETGIRIEDDVLVTETGHRVLSRLKKDLAWASIG